MSIVDDLLAALSEEVQAAGPDEVDKPGPASTRGTADGSESNRRRQKSYTRVESLLPWGAFPNTQEGWDAWRASVARHQMFKDAECGAPSVAHWPDSDELEDEKQRTHTLHRLIDAEGVEWLDVPAWEVDDLPQPVVVLETEQRPVNPRPKPKLAPIEVLGEIKLKKSQGRPAVMSEEQVADALRMLDDGIPVRQVALKHWREWGFKSEASCNTSLRRQRMLRDEQAKAEGWKPDRSHPWRKWKGDPKEAIAA